MNEKEKEYTDKLIKIPWGWNDYYKIGFITPENYNKIQIILSEIRGDKSMCYDDWLTLSEIYKAYYRKYYKVKQLISQEPRLHAQKFIGKKKIRNFIFNRDKKCLRCGTDKNLSIDHIIPIFLGGENKLFNLQTLCKSCNSWKNTNIIDFR